MTRTLCIIAALVFAGVAGATTVPPPCTPTPCVPPPCVDRASCGPGLRPVIEPAQVPVDNPLALAAAALGVAVVAARVLRRK